MSLTQIENWLLFCKYMCCYCSEIAMAYCLITCLIMTHSRKACMLHTVDHSSFQLAFPPSSFAVFVQSKMKGREAWSCQYQCPPRFWDFFFIKPCVILGVLCITWLLGHWVHYWVTFLCLFIEFQNQNQLLSSIMHNLQAPCKLSLTM